MKYRKQYDDLEPDYEFNEGDYLVDDTGYESIPDLLARCIRDRVPVPTQTPGLVEDYEVDGDLEYTDDLDKALYPEDYIDEQPVSDANVNQLNISEPTAVALDSEATSSD